LLPLRQQRPQTPTKEINALYIQAWKLGIKTLYYQHSTSAAQKFSQSKLCTYACEA
jgi:ribonucleoside-diphosphate reductase alpha chain